MKKSIAIIISIIIVLAVIFPVSAISTITVKGITLDKTSISLEAGKIYNLKVTLTPKNTTQKTLTYATSNSKIATVDKAGKITGVAKGTATITVYTYNKKIFAKCTVKVTDTDLGGITITYVNWGSSSWSKPGTDEKGQREEAFRATLEKKYNFKFGYNSIPDNDYLPMVLSSTMAGKPCGDIISLMMDGVPGLASKKLLYPLDQIKSYDFMNDPSILKSVRDAVTWSDGHTYGFYRTNGAYIGSKIFTVFNKKMAASLGLNLYKLRNSGDWTWDKFLEYARLATKDSNNDGVNETWGFTADLNLLGLGYIGSTGAIMLDQNNKINYHDPKILLALEQYAKIKPYFNAPPKDANWDFYMTEFAKGNTLFAHANQWWCTSRYSSMEADWGILPFPSPAKGSPYYTVSDIEGVQSIPYNTKNAEAVGLVIKLLAQPRVWDLDEEGNPLLDKSDPTWFYSNYENQVRDQESLQTLTTLIFKGKFYFDRQRMFNVYWSNPGFSQLCSDVWSGGKTPAQAVQANEKPAQEKLNAAIAEMQKKK